ncbi:Vms1/Ankzf1 family peptidyl-tRNA hydrolase [Natronomonas marina]|jgi:peptide subunit release factor 1 (eRF1)|uniref:Vms1/Ankzf1 family peptidyl-tRNA hydrolase n=1 Tax=Natronomonas marina TaxID=2961939 RepID=UPI0020C985FD|nr:Vms1/Ankzf1 family peptidyl-tRNA hydrolase [Natronomonas marina]
MLDDLLGRTELKERIAELEDERESLQAQLDAERERRSEAARARQEAEERVNRLEDRIADLEGQLEETEESVDLTFRHRESVRGRRLETVLSRLERLENGPESVLTAYVDEAVPDAVADLLEGRAGLLSRAAPCLVCADDAGLVAAALRPPVAPEPFTTWSDGPELDRAWLQPTGRYALALVRSDVFAVGVYEGDERVDFEGFTSDVKSDHSKGGFSQSRFERLRDEQIAEHVERCEAALSGVDADRLYVTGDRRLVGEFDADATAAVDATGEPEAALGDAYDDFWAVPLYGL